MNKMIDAKILSEAGEFAKAHHFRLLVKQDGIMVEKKTHTVEYTRVVSWETIESMIENPLIATMERMRAEFE